MNLTLDGEPHFQGDGRHHFDQQLANGLVDVGTRYDLTVGGIPLRPFAIAQVVGPLAPVGTHVVTGAHSFAATPAQQKPLK